MSSNCSGIVAGVRWYPRDEELESEQPGGRAKKKRRGAREGSRGISKGVKTWRRGRV
jgi:hypothetical protein